MYFIHHTLEILSPKEVGIHRKLIGCISFSVEQDTLNIV